MKPWYEDNAFYHGAISRDIAYHRLASHSEGAWLLYRDEERSSDEQLYMTVIYNREYPKSVKFANYEVKSRQLHDGSVVLNCNAQGINLTFGVQYQFAQLRNLDPFIRWHPIPSPWLDADLNTRAALAAAELAAEADFQQISSLLITRRDLMLSLTATDKKTGRKISPFAVWVKSREYEEQKKKEHNEHYQPIPITEMVNHLFYDMGVAVNPLASHEKAGEQRDLYEKQTDSLMKVLRELEKTLRGEFHSEGYYSKYQANLRVFFAKNPNLFAFLRQRQGELENIATLWQEDKIIARTEERRLDKSVELNTKQIAKQKKVQDAKKHHIMRDIVKASRQNVDTFNYVAKALTYHYYYKTSGPITELKSYGDGAKPKRQVREALADLLWLYENENNLDHLNPLNFMADPLNFMSAAELDDSNSAEYDSSGGSYLGDNDYLIDDEADDEITVEKLISHYRDRHDQYDKRHQPVLPDQPEQRRAPHGSFDNLCARSHQWLVRDILKFDKRLLEPDYLKLCQKEDKMVEDYLRVTKVSREELEVKRAHNEDITIVQNVLRVLADTYGVSHLKTRDFWELDAILRPQKTVSVAVADESDEEEPELRRPPSVAAGLDFFLMPGERKVSEPTIEGKDAEPSVAEDDESPSIHPGPAKTPKSSQ